MEQAVTAANGKSETYKSRIDALENDSYQIRIERAGLTTQVENVRYYPWGSSNNLTFAFSCGK